MRRLEIAVVTALAFVFFGTPVLAATSVLVIENETDRDLHFLVVHSQRDKVQKHEIVGAGKRHKFKIDFQGCDANKNKVRRIWVQPKGKPDPDDRIAQVEVHTSAWDIAGQGCTRTFQFKEKEVLDDRYKFRWRIDNPKSRGTIVVRPKPD